MDSQNVAHNTGLLDGGSIDGESNHDDHISIASSESADEYCNQIPAQVDSSTKKAQRTCNFTTMEDILLISAWLNISMETVQENDHKKMTYWERVWDYFHKHKIFKSDRSTTSLMNRWSAIQIAVNKFSECYTQIEERRRSGVTELDMILQAKHMYQELHRASFQFEHCWNKLRYQPKWIEMSRKKKTKVLQNRSPSDSSTPDSVNLGDDNARDNTFVDLKRPLGGKTEKERLHKLKNKKCTSHKREGYAVMLLGEMKENRQMNQRKTEVITESEERAYVQEKERISLERGRLRLEIQKEEERIMSVDTSGMPPMQAEYYRLRQMEILEKGVDSNF